MTKAGKVADLNLVERIGLQILRRCASLHVSQIREWSKPELERIQGIERRTKLIAALAGALSGGLLALVEMFLGGAVLDLHSLSAWRGELPYWSLYGALVALISGAEVLYLYAYALKSVARISSAAGISLSAREIEDLIARGLARAALEIPNPRESIRGIDPYARVARWRLIAYTLLYRVKVGLTSFLLRVLLRRVLARTAFRIFIPLVSVPVFAVWNALIAHWVLREVRVRVTGPLAVRQLREQVAAVRERLDVPSRRWIVQAVAEMVVRGEDAHPNYVLLVDGLLRELRTEGEALQPDWNATRAALPGLPPEPARIVLISLTLAAVLNGRIRRAQRQLLEEAFGLCARPFRYEAVLQLRQDLLDGKGISPPRLRMILGNERDG